MEISFLNRIRVVVFCSLCLTAFESILSQTLIWKSPVSWDSAEVYGDNMLRVKQSGKCGIVSFSGTLLIPYENGIITDMCEDRFLLLDNNNRILSLRDNRCNSIPLCNKKGNMIHDDFFVDPAWPYFSEGLLAVRDSEGKWGFINTSGQIVIKNIYRKVYPFRYGRSAVQYKNENWCHIDKKGNPRPNDKRLGLNRRDYISSYTQIENRLYSIVFIDDKMFMIDIDGIIRNDMLSVEGIRMPISYLLKNDSILSGSTDETTIVFNNRGECEFIKNNYNEYKTTPKDYPPKAALKMQGDFEIDQKGRIKIDSLVISPQFQDIIPLTNDRLLIKKENQWNILAFDRTKNCIKIQLEKPLNNGNDSELAFSLSDRITDARAYVINNQEEVVYFEIIGGAFKVPAKFIDKDNQITVGVEKDGILIEPYIIPVLTQTLERSKFKVELSPKTKEKNPKMIKDGETECVEITITKESNRQLPYNLYINGRLSKSKVTDRIIKEKLYYPIYFGSSDKKKIKLIIEIQEDGATDRVSYPKICYFEKLYESESKK